MKKPYSLDFSIERDIDRMHAVEEILDKLEKIPSSTELEQMGSYILYGKDENGLNAYQRGEMLADRRYTSYKTKDDQLLSLDAFLENPLTDQREIKPVNYRNPYTQKKTTIDREKDADIPGMKELWQSIDRLTHWIAVLEGKVAPQPDDLLFDDPYRLYRLKHTLIDLRRHQYYLKDSYKPTIHFLAADHPKRQFINWDSDTYYWISREEWEHKIQTTYSPLVSKNLDDYETRKNSQTGEIEIKWVVSRHTFDWENPSHIQSFLLHYRNLYELLYDKLDTYGRTLIFDFERYRALANFSPVRNWLIDCRFQQLTCDEMAAIIEEECGCKYSASHIYHILSAQIPNEIALVAKKTRLLVETPLSDRKICRKCGRALPMDLLFFSRDNSRKDLLSGVCKECQKKKRIEGDSRFAYDRRNKEASMHSMQTR